MALRTYFALMDPFKSGGLETVSQLYLTGRGDRSYFDARAMYFYGLSGSDVQSQLPIVHPVVDYRNSSANPLFGGELTYRANLISLSRDSAEFDPISQHAFNTGQCASLTADPASKTPANCILRGFPGTYSRASAEATWRRTLIDPWGEKWTPFVSMRADVAALSVQNETGVSPTIFRPATAASAASCPRSALEYRYPFISVHSWGTQTIEPIAQLIVRPNETQIGKLPNEDAQSLIFDDSNLFSVNKFSGWDRIEGGGAAECRRFNTRRSSTMRGFVNALFGQSLPAVRPKLVRGPRYRQHRPVQRTRQAAIGLCRARRLSAGHHLFVDFPFPAWMRRHSRYAGSSSRDARFSIAGSSRPSTETTTPSPRSASCRAGRA